MRPMKTEICLCQIPNNLNLNLLQMFCNWTIHYGLNLAKITYSWSLVHRKKIQNLTRNKESSKVPWAKHRKIIKVRDWGKVSKYMKGWGKAYVRTCHQPQGMMKKVRSKVNKEWGRIFPVTNSKNPGHFWSPELPLLAGSLDAMQFGQMALIRLLQ